MAGCRDITDEEIDKIYEYLDDGRKHARRNIALFLVGLWTGFRASELLSLRRSDVVEGGSVTDSIRVFRRHMKKKRISRTVVLPAEPQKALEAWLEELQEQGYVSGRDFVWQSARGVNKAIHRTRAWAILHNAKEACNIPGKVALHSLRKTYAIKLYALLIKAGGPNANPADALRALQLALGHKEINSTISYLPSFEQAQIDALTPSLSFGTTTKAYQGMLAL